MLNQSLDKAISLTRLLYDDFKEFLSPSACLCCGRARDFADPHLCPSCVQVLMRKNIGNGPVCPFCGRPLGAVWPCTFCDSPDCLRLYYWGIYDEELKECLHQFKFHGAVELGSRLAEMAVTALQERITGNRYDLLVAVPLHKKREKERLFNQSNVIVQKLSELLHTEILEGVLIRVKATKQQAKLVESQRWSNVKDAFALNDQNGRDLYGRSVLLVDDIVTTGATVYEASRPLLNAGVSRLDVFSIAYAR